METLGGRIDFETGDVSLPEMNLTPELVNHLNKIIIVACGTALLRSCRQVSDRDRLPASVEVEYASEFRYYHPIIDDQNGCTRHYAVGRNGRYTGGDGGATRWRNTVTIVNAFGSQAMRVSDGYTAMHAGPEIGVASTKAFTTSIVDQYLLAVALGRLKGSCSAERARELI